MIDVQQLFLNVQSLALKDKGGYMDPDEFNRFMLQSQQLLYGFYFDQFERHQKIPEALRYFVVLDSLPLSSLGAAALPDDFQHCISAYYGLITNVAGGEPTVTYYETTPLHASEVALTLSSAVRSPSLARRRLYHRVISGEVQLYTDRDGGLCKLEYLRTPAQPNRATTLDATNDQYNYDANTSTQIEFQEYDLPNFTDLMLLHYGLETRQSEVIQWAQMKRPVANQISQ